MKEFEQLDPYYRDSDHGHDKEREFDDVYIVVVLVLTFIFSALSVYFLGIGA